MEFVDRLSDQEIEERIHLTQDFEELETLMLECGRREDQVEMQLLRCVQEREILEAKLELLGVIPFVPPLPLFLSQSVLIY